MAIQNQKPKPKASSKTDAMKALKTPSSDVEVSDAEGAEPLSNDAPAKARPRVPVPIVRPAPVAPRPVVAWQSLRSSALTRRSTDDEAEVSAPEGVARPAKIAFDPVLWQWRDEGGFIHIKTGEVREETEFLDPNAKSGTSDDEADWDSGGDDW